MHLDEGVTLLLQQSDVCLTGQTLGVSACSCCAGRLVNLINPPQPYGTVECGVSRDRLRANMSQCTPSIPISCAKSLAVNFLNKFHRSRITEHPERNLKMLF